MKAVLVWLASGALLFLNISCVNQAVGSTPATILTPSVTGSPPVITSIPPMSDSTLTFDFDSGLLRGKGTPLEQTVGGITASFSSPSDPGAFSIQRQETTFLPITNFSGNYLFQNSIFPTRLIIRFSKPLTQIQFSFATMDSHSTGEADIPTTLRLTAYENSTKTSMAGIATAMGTFANEAYPQGLLSFGTDDRNFDTIELELIRQPRGTSIFHLDNIVVVVSGK